MRRLTALLLITLMLTASALPICAKEYADNGTDTPNAEVVHSQGGEQVIGSDENVGNVDFTYGVKEEFIVTIPAKVDMVLNTTVNEAVSVSNVHLPRAKNLVIKVSGSYYTAGTAGWKLQNLDNEDVYLAYKVAQSDGGEAISNNTSIITYNVGDNTTGGTSTNLYFNVTGEPTIGGQYLDYLVFTVYITNKTN